MAGNSKETTLPASFHRMTPRSVSVCCITHANTQLRLRPGATPFIYSHLQFREGEELQGIRGSPSQFGMAQLAKKRKRLVNVREQVGEESAVRDNPFSHSATLHSGNSQATTHSSSFLYQFDIFRQFLIIQPSLINRFLFSTSEDVHVSTFSPRTFAARCPAASGWKKMTLTFRRKQKNKKKK